MVKMHSLKYFIALLITLTVPFLTACNDNSTSKNDTLIANSQETNFSDTERKEENEDGAISEECIQENGVFKLTNKNKCRKLFVWQTIRYESYPTRGPAVSLYISDPIDVMQELKPNQSVEFDIAPQDSEWSRAVLISLESGHTFAYLPYTLFSDKTETEAPILSPILLLDHDDTYLIRAACCNNSDTATHTAQHQQIGQCYSFSWIDVDNVTFQVARDLNRSSSYCNVNLWFSSIYGGFNSPPPIRYFVTDTKKAGFTINKGTTIDGHYSIQKINGQ